MDFGRDGWHPSSKILPLLPLLPPLPRPHPRLRQQHYQKTMTMTTTMMVMVMVHYTGLPHSPPLARKNPRGDIRKVPTRGVDGGKNSPWRQHCRYVVKLRL